MKRIHIIILLGFVGFAPGLLEAQEETAVPVITNTQTERVIQNEAPAFTTMIFKVQFVRPQLVADKVRELMGAASGGVIVNTQAGELEISAHPEMIQKIKDLIANLDKERDITIDVKVVQVNLDEEHLPGINWSAIVSDYKSFAAHEENRQYSLGTVSQEDLSVLLEALETVGETKIYPVHSKHLLSSQDVDLRLKAFDRDVDVKMTVDPVGLSDEQQDRYTARILISPTAIGEDTIDLRVISPDGTVSTLNIKNDTVAIVGGIFTQTKSESTTKFPFLGDVPILGIVFRDQSKVVQRLENILIVTPRVTAPAKRP